MSSSAARLASLVIPLASLISLTACRGVVVAGSTGAPPSTTATTATTGAADDTAGGATAPADSGAPAATSAPAVTPGGAGTLAISVTSPVSESETTTARVTCAQTAVLYLASAVNSHVAGYDHSFTVRVARYRGPGTYHALVTLTVTGPRGGIASVSGVPDIPVTITSTGGTFTVDRAGDDGKLLHATVTWTCP